MRKLLEPVVGNVERKHDREDFVGLREDLSCGARHRANIGASPPARKLPCVALS